MSLAVLVIFHFLNPDSPVLLSCPIYRLAGLYCPGCGITRALHLLATGHPAAAFAMNPLLACLLPGAALLLIFRRFRDAQCGSMMRSPVFSWTIFALVVFFTVARNLPWEPFRLLAPGAMLGQ